MPRITDKVVQLKALVADSFMHLSRLVVKVSKRTNLNSQQHQAPTAIITLIECKKISIMIWSNHSSNKGLIIGKSWAVRRGRGARASKCFKAKAIVAVEDVTYHTIGRQASCLRCRDSNFLKRCRSIARHRKTFCLGWTLAPTKTKCLWIIITSSIIASSSKFSQVTCTMHTERCRSTLSCNTWFNRLALTHMSTPTWIMSIHKWETHQSILIYLRPLLC